MKNKLITKVILCVLVVFGFIVISNWQCLALAFNTNFTNYQREIQYKDYLMKYQQVAKPALVINFPAVEFTNASNDIKILNGISGYSGKAIWTGERSFVEWEINVPQGGLYNIEFKYCPAKGRSSNIEREIIINGSRPFKEAQYLQFGRVWKNKTTIKRDSLGNEIRPEQVEDYFWQLKILNDSTGYEQRPYLFYFRKGKNTIRLISRNEPMIIASFRLFQEKLPESYQNLAGSYVRKAFNKTRDVFVKIQGENALYKSSPTLFPINDQGDPTLEPYDPAKIRLNTIGGQRWATSGQWIAWEFEVPEDGLYKIALKAKQDVQQGACSNRKIYIDGKVPFKELETVRFGYSSNYKMYVLGEKDKEYLFYLTKGKHKLKMEVVLGNMNKIVAQIEKSLYELNTIYRKIIMITSANPDPMRNYEIDKKMPELIDRIKTEKNVIKTIEEELEKEVGQIGEQLVILKKFVILLNNMIKDPELIPGSLGAFRDNIGALGTWLMKARQQPLEIDYIVIVSPEQNFPSAKPTFLQTLSHEARAFVASFTHDYTNIGNMKVSQDEIKQNQEKNKNVLKVWLGTGRDQAQILKKMIEDTFTPETGISVELELITQMNKVLVPATVAGTGPDLALGVNVQDPMNFAMRGAIVDLTIFDDFEQIAKRFQKSAFLPYRFRNSVFALPEQQTFPILFYRKDVLAELGIEVPNTWDDVYKIMPVLQKNNMEFGLGAGIGGTGVGTFLTFLYQSGGHFYKEDGVETNLDSELAIKSFTDLTNFFTLYQLPLTFNKENRFRMGEMPLVISDYGLYNRLKVFAPELRGEWGFTLIPGTLQTDGEINRTVASTGMGAALTQAGVGGPAAIMMDQSEMKEEAWKFMKWWTRSDTQVRFGRELESLMGAAARYPTANIEAFKQLPWTVRERKVLLQQWDWVEGTREVPGSYYATRLFDWAFRAVVLNYETPRETLMSYDRKINNELSIKRKEFGLVLDIDKVKEKWKKQFWSHYTHLKLLYEDENN